MNIVSFGDIHFRLKNPKNRIDNFFETQLGKIEFGLKYFIGLPEPKLLTTSGDVFDMVQGSAKTPHYVVQRVIELFRKYKVTMLTVAGQHDQPYHTKDLEDTPLKVLEKAGVVILLNKYPITVDGVSFYGCSFGEEIPKIDACTSDRTNVLVIHKMIVKNPLWEGQTDYTYSQNLLAKCPYNFILSGDNHEFFTDEYKGKILVNLGSLMRSKIDQRDHLPSISIYDTNDGSLNIKMIPSEPFADVMNLEEAVKEKEKEQQVNAFVEGLKESTEMTLDFVSNLRSYIETNKVDDQVTSIINTCLGGN